MMNRFVSYLFFGLAILILAVGAYGLGGFIRSEIKLVFPFLSPFFKDESRIIFQVFDYVLNFIILAAIPGATGLILHNQINLFHRLDDIEDVIRDPNKKPLTRRERFNRDVLGR